jgi:hypothetical protein
MSSTGLESHCRGKVEGNGNVSNNRHTDYFGSRVVGSVANSHPTAEGDDQKDCDGRMGRGRSLMARESAHCWRATHMATVIVQYWTVGRTDIIATHYALPITTPGDMHHRLSAGRG